MTPEEYAKKYNLSKSYIGNLKKKMCVEHRLIVFGPKGDRFNEAVLHQLWPSKRLPNHLFNALSAEDKEKVEHFDRTPWKLVK